jgi:hypothetical protein
VHILVQKEQSRHPGQSAVVGNELTPEKKSKIKRFIVTYMEKVVAKFNAKKSQSGADTRKRKASTSSSSGSSGTKQGSSDGGKMDPDDKRAKLSLPWN